SMRLLERTSAWRRFESFFYSTPRGFFGARLSHRHVDFMTKVESTEASTLIQLFFQSRTKKSKWRISKGLRCFLNQKRKWERFEIAPIEVLQEFLLFASGQRPYIS